MAFHLETIVLIISLIWTAVLTILFGQMLVHYNNLTKNITQKTLKAVLEGIIKDINTAKIEIGQLQKHSEALAKDGMLHIQKIGLLRFNPFKDTGGDQSFILALLNEKDTGIVISGLYSRSGTRWYAKSVTNGKGVEHELSDEEKKAISAASKQIHE